MLQTTTPAPANPERVFHIRYRSRLLLVEDLVVDLRIDFVFGPAEFDADTRLRLHAHDTRLLHTFGNLTLLARELNSSVSNDSYAKERPDIASQSELRLNTWFQTHLEWGEPQIMERGAHLLSVAKEVWPGP